MNFLKGIVVGLGAIAPGLSGSVLLVIFGLYQKTINAVSTLFKNFIKNVKFLLPLATGILIGVVIFRKIINFFLLTFEMQTRFAFLGFILGSIPLFYKEVRKEGFAKIYYVYIIGAFLFGTFLFGFNRSLFPQVANPNLFQSILIGFVVACSYIVPGIDSAAILSALGIYEIWVKSLANLDFTVLLPAALGLITGVLIVSYIINKLISRHYTMTFSVIFGLFLSIIPSVLNDSCVVGLDMKTFISFIILIISFALSLLFSNLEKIKDKKISQ